MYYEDVEQAIKINYIVVFLVVNIEYIILFKLVWGMKVDKVIILIFVSYYAVFFA
jgi:hypothetical protein